MVQTIKCIVMMTKIARSKRGRVKNMYNFDDMLVAI